MNFSNIPADQRLNARVGKIHDEESCRRGKAIYEWGTVIKTDRNPFGQEEALVAFDNGTRGNFLLTSLHVEEDEVNMSEPDFYGIVIYHAEENEE